MNLQCFLFVFSFAVAAPNFLARKTRWSTEIQGETEQQLAQRIFVPLPQGTRYGKYRPDTDIALLPNDIWHIIGDTLDPLSVWSLGLTCKYFAAMVRDNSEGLFYIISHPLAFPQILWNSNLNLYGHMKPVLDPFLKAYHDYHSNFYGHNAAHGVALKNMFRLRAGDFEAAALPMDSLSGMDRSSIISHAVAQHLFRTLNSYELLYLPPVGTKLFDRIDAREVAQLTQTRAYASSFNYCLLMDYIVPTFGQPNQQLSDFELTALKFINIENSVTFQTYFESLHWAIFFLTKAVRVNDARSKAIRTPIERHLASLGLSWKKLWRSKTFKNMGDARIQGKLAMMPAILLAAKQWGLDWIEIAKTTAGWAPISQDILDGTIPKYLNDDFTLNLPELVKIFTEEFVEPLYVMNRELVTARSLKSNGIKRPRPSNDFEEPPKKLRKLDRLVDVPLACIQTIQESVQKLIESGIGNFRVAQITETMMQLCGLLDEELSPGDVEDVTGLEETGMTVDQDVFPFFDVTQASSDRIFIDDPTPVIAPMAPAPVMMGAPALIMGGPAPFMMGPIFGAPFPAMGGLAPIIGGPAPVMIGGPAPIVGGPAPVMIGGPAPIMMGAPAPMILDGTGMGNAAPIDAQLDPNDYEYDHDVDIYLDLN